MQHKKMRVCRGFAAAAGIVLLALLAVPQFAHGWTEADFARRPLVAYPVSSGRDDLIGALQTYTIRKGDTLLDVGRWFGVSAREISDANHHMDWWSPPVGKTIIIPTEHILPMAPHSGIIINIPELRLYYYPSRKRMRRKGVLLHTKYRGARVVYTFPVGLGRYDWRTPVGKTFRVTAKEHNPPWIVPKDIYEEHMERDGFAEHMIPGGSPDNPEGHWRLDLNLPEYAIHGTNNPWGVGMEVSHGCIRLAPENIDRLWHIVPVGTKGHIVYEPVKFGWSGNSLYVEVHRDIYGKYPGLWRHAISVARHRKLLVYIDRLKLEKAIEEKTGLPTYVMPGPEPPGAMPPTTETASSVPLPASGSAARTPDSDVNETAMTTGDTAPAAKNDPAMSDGSATADHGGDRGFGRPIPTGIVPAPAAPAPMPARNETTGWQRTPRGAMPIE